MAESSTRTVDRALSLLGIVCDRGSVSLADAARDADLSASTALRLLRTLEAQEFIRREADGRYTPGSRIVQLGALALANESLVSLASDAMHRMVEATGESCYLSIRGAGETALYIAIVEGTHSVRHASWVGRSIPLHGSAAGTVLTGGVDAAGYSIVRQGVESDVTAIAVPVMVGHRIVAALSSVVPSYRVDDDQIARIGDLLITEAGSIIAAPAVTSTSTDTGANTGANTNASTDAQHPSTTTPTADASTPGAATPTATTPGADSTPLAEPASLADSADPQSEELAS